MALIDLVAQSDAPQSAFIYELGVGNGTTINRVPGGLTQPDTMYFQYWPQTLQDDYQVEYAEHLIPGGSHPLYQWVGGRGRTISFQALFTSEINTDRVGGAARPDIVSPLSLSAKYTVDVAAALSRVRSWMRPKYGSGGEQGLTDPPPILVLTFSGTGLNGKNLDSVNVILRSAPITYESWYPNGRPRVSVVDFTFSEIVQKPHGAFGEGSSVKFIDRREFKAHGTNYKVTGLGDRPFLSGGL